MFNKPPIFIFGNRRSGTTLLRLMLTSHQNIVIPPEGDFVVRLGWKYDTRKLNPEVIEMFINDLFKMENIQDWEIDRVSVRERLLGSQPNTYPELVNEIYKEYNQVKFSGTKKRWGDKTTWYTNHISQIRRYFPDMKVIHIIRDVRAVVASYQDVPHLPNDVKEATLDWLWTTKITDSSRHLFSQKHWFQIRYEDLVQNPKRELINICRFLDEPFQEDMLNYWKHNKEKKLEPLRHMGWKRKTLEKVTTKQTDRWKTKLSQGDQAIIIQQSRIAMKRYGYDFPEMKISIVKEFYLTVNQMGVFFFRNIIQHLRETKARVLTHLGFN